MSQNVAVGIDIGTSKIKVAVAEFDRGQPRIIGRGLSESRGMRHGYIINPTDIVRSIKQAIVEAEKSSGTTIDSAYIAVGGIGLSSCTAEGSTIMSRADSEVSDLDLTKVLEASEQNIPPSESLNRKILHSIPLEYKIDCKLVLGSPLGMKGVKLQVKTLFITSLENHLNDLMDAVEETGTEVIDVSAAPIAASFITLSKTQKIAGCVLANIGAETLSVAVFENNLPISLEIFPIGATDITHDIALGLKIPIEEAEKVKIGTITSTSYPEKRIDEIVQNRINDMLKLIDAHLKKQNKSGMLPAGIILTGGGASVGQIETLAKNTLNLPSERIEDDQSGRSLKQASWAVAYGLCILGLTSGSSRTTSRGSHKIRKLWGGVSEWFKQFLP